MTASEARSYLDRARDQARARRILDWRQALLPAAIKRDLGKAALRVCDALCDHQRAGNNYFPHVWVGVDELAEELGMDEANVRRALRRLKGERLLAVELGGGRLPATKNHKGRANTYRLGPACGRSVKGVAVDPLKALDTRSPLTPYPPPPELHTGSAVTPHPSGVLRTPSGDRGERTVALTGDPPPSSRSQTITAHHFRDLWQRFSPGKTRG